jgi:hypothetical protein
MLDMIFMCAMRAQTFFDEARRFVRNNQFEPVNEPHYSILWTVLCALRDAGSRFTHHNVMTEVHRVLESNPGYLHPNLQPHLTLQTPQGIIWTAFNASVEEIDLHTARAYLRDFLHERTVASPLRRFMASVSLGEVPLGLNEFLDTVVNQRQSIQTMDTLPLVLAVPDLNTILEPPLIYNPTGIDWIDNPLGGVCEGDAIGIIGGTGSGKSTLAAHIAVSCAKRENLRAMQEGRAPRWVAFFTYEESVKKMRVRIWSAGFQIERARLENLTNPAAQLTSRANMLPYEYQLFGPEGQAVSEQERWVAGSQWMNRTLALFDMSGSAEFPSAGKGFIPEMVACLDAESQRRGTPPVLTITDYAGLTCRNYIAARDLDDNSLRPLLAEFGNRQRREIAERFGATSLIMHQIAPAEGQRGPTALMHHTMASESRAFAENLAICGCIGNPDPQTGCRRLNWSKLRHRPQEQAPPITLRISDQFAIMDDVSSIYSVDDSGRRFVLKELLNQVHGGGAAQPQAATPNPPNVRVTGMDAGEASLINPDGTI